MLQHLLSQIDALQAQIIARRPLTSAEAASLRNYYRIGLTWSSNAIEGNTLNESETKVVLEDGLTISGKPLREHLEANGHARALEGVWKMQHNPTITEADACAIHRLFYYAISPDEAGHYRASQVFISGSKFPCPPPPKIAAAITRLFERLPERRAALHPVTFAAWLHKEFVFIHPFIDGNGRVARLLMNLALLQRDYLATLIPPVRRHDYYAALETAHTDDTAFTLFVAECHLEAQRDFLRLFG